MFDVVMQMCTVRDGKSPHELFERRADASPEALAVVHEGQSLSYRELDARADCVAAYLASLGVGPEALVGISVEPSLEMIVGMLGILKAGCAFVPIDPRAPRERLAQMLRDSDARVLLTQARLEPALAGCGARLVRLDRDWPAIASCTRSWSRHRPSLDAASYCLYTSGSTGKPKGVLVTARSITNLIEDWNDRHPVRPDERFSLWTAFTFDVSIFEWLLPLASGASVAIPSEATRLDPERFMRWTESSRITTAYLPPHIARLLPELMQRGIRAPSRILVGVEPLEERALCRALASSKTTLVNGYGPTEATVYSTLFTDPPTEQERAIPIGRPIAHTAVYILDEHSRPVPSGAVGEIHIAGAGLARGYLNRPGLTAEKFVADPYGPPGSRMYRTGDRGRYLPDGNIAFVGRDDGQVKLRGYRIELGEIESVLRAHAAVSEALAVVREDVPGDKRLVAYVVPREAEAATDVQLREYLEQRLPEYMVPSAVTMLAALPRTPSGKVDRQALPAPEARPERAYEPPRTELEELLARVWATVLRVERVGRRDHFFERGGDSLLAMRVVAQLREVLQVELPVRALFESPTLVELAERTERQRREDRGVRLPELRARSREGKVQQSFAQERLWFLEQLGLVGSAYQLPIVLRLEGPLEVSALQRSLGEVVRRHESLRTRFASHGGEGAQIIDDAAPSFELAVEDLRSLSREERARRAQEWQQRERRPFDLERGPLFRARLLRLEPEAHVLLLTMHHIVTDGWSLGIVMRELGALYGAYARGEVSPLAEPTLQYADYALWQRQWLQGEVLDTQLAYWKKTLQGAQPLELPTDRRRPAVQSFRGGLVPFAISERVTEQLIELGRSEGATLYMVLLAAIQVLLSRWSGRKDVVVGSPTAGRTHQHTEDLVGFFVNMLALRTDLSGSPAFRDVLRQVKDVTLSAYAHQDVPFEKVVEALQPQRDLSRQPVFQVNFTLQNAPMDPLQLPGVRVEQADTIEHASAQYDVSFLIEQSAGGLRGHIEYASDLFERSTIERVSEWLGRLLESIVRAPERTTGELRLVSEAEQDRVVNEWNRTEREYPRSCVHELFSQQAQRTPEAVALEQGEDRLTYGELERRSNQLARHLVRVGVGPEVMVGLCVERSLSTVIAVLGILKAGGAYLPLDPKYPAERLSFMLEDAKAAVLVTESALEDALPAHWARVVRLDEDGEQIARHSPDALEARARAENLAYVMYTSGSTGRPKGVGVVHGNIVRLIDPMAVTPDDVLLHLAPLAFDASTFEIWGALLHGAKLVLAPASVDLSEVPQLIQSRGVSVLWLTAGLFHQLVEHHLPLLGGVETLLAGGDALSVEHVKQVRKALPGCRMINGYGPTECTTFSTLHDVKELGPEATTVPIGAPLPNAQVYVLDERREVVPIGVVGELYIGGGGVARGYVGRGGLTAERFVPHPFAAGERVYRTGDLVRWNERAELELIGRTDHQVKVRGHRIELGEIESALSAHAGVSQAVVVARADGPGDKRLVAYVVAADGEAPTSLQLREYLGQRLPEYMVPSVVMLLEELPLTPNGKVDRRMLPVPEGRPEGVGYEAPRTDVERALAQIWEEVLRVERIGIRDDFFDVGGDSIRALHVQAQARKRGYEFSLKELFALKHIAALAAVMRTTRAGALVREPVAPFSLLGEADRAKARQAGYEDAYPLSLLQAGLVFHNLWERGSATYHDVISHEVHAQLDEAAFVATVQSVVDRHPMLRTTIHLEEYEQPLQCVHEHLPAAVQVADWTDLTDLEQQRRLREWMQQESRSEFDLPRGPLVKFRAYRLKKDVFQFLLSVHHAVIDGWSVAALSTEIYEGYLQRLAGMPVGPRAPLQMHYRDFIAQEREALQDREHEQYWEGVVGRLERAPLWRLARPSAAPAEADLSETLRSTITPELARKLAAFAQQAGVPVKSALFTAHLNALRAFMGGREVKTGLVMHSRPEGVDAEKVVGLFLNTVPVCFVSEGGTWQALVRQVLQLEQEALAHRMYPVVDVYRRHGGKELLDVIFNFVNFHVAHPLADRLHVKQSDGVFETNFPLSVSVELDARAGNGGAVGFCYQTSRFSRRQMESLQELFLSSLRAMVERPLQAYEELALLPAQDRALLEQWNRTQREYPRACLHDLIEQQARRTPHAIAVKLGAEQLTYEELERRSIQVAHHLNGLGVGPEVLVGVFMERSLEMVIALYGILKAGGAYVPIDPDYPAERVAFMAQDSHVQVLLTQQHLVERLPRQEAHVICLDADWPLIASRRVEEFRSAVAPESLAYVIYTSGSTGKPKAAMNTHRSICNRLQWMQDTYRLTASDRVLQKTPFSFDVSVWEFFWPLLAGACLVLARPEGHKDSAYLAALIAEEEITTLHFVPSMLHAFLQEPGLRACRSLKRVFSSGEALPFDLQERFFQRLGAELHNLYGPTEAAVDVTFWECKPHDPRRMVPIGRPVANTQIHVLDADLRPVPIGVAGELHIGGVQVGRGYLNRPELTAEKFIEDPFTSEPTARLYKTGDLARYLPDGSIEYLGRLDHQVKIRGFRIELEEIDAVLGDHPGVQEAIVLAREDRPGDPRLVAYLVADQERASAIRRLQRFEREGLLAEHARYELPNGMAIVHKNKGETDFTYREIFEGQTYLKHGITLDEGSCVFDVGANIGLFTLFVGQMCKSAVVYAFEPVPPIFDILRLNADLHGVNAVLCEYGLSNKAGSDTFTYYPHVSVVSGRFADAAEEREVVKSFVMNQPREGASEALLDEMVRERLKGERVHCQLRTLSDVMDEHGVERIDLLKIDAEKSESDVLAGIREGDWQKIRQIVVEVHDIGGRLGEMKGLLERHGYLLTIEQEAMLENTSLYTVYATRQSPSLEVGKVGCGRGRARESTWSSPDRLVRDVRHFLQKKLPEHMVPSAFVLLEALPLTANGKVDRRALPAPDSRSAARAYEAPRTTFEQRLARIWAQVLSVERVGLHDNFFELGGHSLLATSVMARLRSQLGIDVGLRVLFEVPTLEAFARRITVLDEYLEAAAQRTGVAGQEYDEGVI